MQVLVTLATYRKSRTAYALKEILENENIDCFFNITHDAEQHVDQFRVQVRGEDVEKAVKVLMGIRERYGRDIEEIEPVSDSRRIMVPTDFSAVSENACRYTIHLSEKIGAEIKVLHVFENPVNDEHIKKQMATFEEYVTETIGYAEDRSKTAMLEFIGKLKQYMGNRQIGNVRIHSSITMGSLVPTIREAGEIYKPNLIVFGIPGTEENSRQVFSGLADEFIRSLEVPLFAIPAQYSPGAFTKVNILYATDFNENDHTSLNRLLDIMEPFDKRITCIHIDTEHNPSKKERMDELNGFLKEHYPSHEIQCRLIEQEDYIKGIREFADTNRMDLLSLTTRKRGIFEKLFRPNLVKQVLQEANLPVLIFPS